MFCWFSFIKFSSRLSFVLFFLFFLYSLKSSLNFVFEEFNLKGWTRESLNFFRDLWLKRKLSLLIKKNRMKIIKFFTWRIPMTLQLYYLKILMVDNHQELFLCIYFHELPWIKWCRKSLKFHADNLLFMFAILTINKVLYT